MGAIFKRGLVVGKFSPLHVGHELVIRRALADCEEVLLISYSKPELAGCDAPTRENWLATLFPRTTRLVVSDQLLEEWSSSSGQRLVMPHNDADHSTHRRFTGFLCLKVLGKIVDAVFTSEDYGEGFARELTDFFREHEPSVPTVRHVLVDRERTQIPISGTKIRSDVHTHRGWLSPIVYASFVRRVCMLGGESSGKSTLAEALARSYGTVHVPEYGRELWESKQGALSYKDMLQIGQTQVAAEEQALLQAHRFLFCDTSPLTTVFYSQHLFGRVEPKLQALAERPYDLVVLCGMDFDFVQDGTRQDAMFRERQHEWYITELNRRKTRFVVASGTVAERIRQVRHYLETGA